MKLPRQAAATAALVLAAAAAPAHEGHPMAPGLAQPGHIHLLDGVTLGPAWLAGLVLALATAAWLLRRSARRPGVRIHEGARRGRFRASR